MYLDIFSKLSETLNQVSPLQADPIFSFITPSTPVCYSVKNKEQLGSCLRELWFEKNNYQKTNILNKNSDHVKMSAYIGNVWETWFINLIKQQPNLFVAEQILATYPENFVKGYADLLIKNPNTDKLELIEVKTYDGGSYFSSEVYGDSNKQPTPKIKHLLQAFRYLLIYKNKVDAINLVYIDRSCTSWFRNKQFRITLENFNNQLYPRIEVLWNGELYSYVNSHITEKSVLETEAKLLESIRQNKIPKKDFKAQYTKEEIEEKYKAGLIYKTSYNKYQEDNSIVLGDFQCAYCPYSKGTCEKYGD